MGDPGRFQKAGDVGAYLGMVRRRDQSGATNRTLPITKSGNAYLRRLLVSRAHYILGPFGQDCDLRERGLKLIERGGRGAKKKAVIATARKLPVLMLTLWRDRLDYRPRLETA